MLLPFKSEIDTIANKIKTSLKESDESLEIMLKALREERKNNEKEG